MWVGFLYTEVIRVSLGPGETRVSKKGMEPLFLIIEMVRSTDTDVNRIYLS